MPEYNYRPTLKTINIAPQQYQFKSFTPQQADMNLLANSMQQKEERINNADKQRAIVTNALGAIRERINTSDPTTAKRFQQRVDDINNQLNQYTSVGRYGDALRMATRLAGDLSNDAELQGMVRTNDQYQKARQSIQSRNDISDLTKERWLSSNKYNFNTITDDDGNIIGAEDWKETWTPTADINPDTINSQILQAAAPDSTSTSSTTSTGGTTTTGGSTASGGTEQHSKGGTHSRTSSNSLEQLTPEKIDAAREDYYNRNRRAIGQMYDNLVWKIGQLRQQLKNETDEDKRQILEGQLRDVEGQITNENGIYQTPKDMFMAMTSKLDESATYKRRATSTGREDVNNRSDETYDGSSGIGSGLGTGTYGTGGLFGNLYNGSTWGYGGTVGYNYTYPKLGWNFGGNRLNFSYYGNRRN